MKILITGGAGFIGVNCADHYLSQGHQVIIFDNLSRKGGELNLPWLRERHGDSFTFIKGDIRDYSALCSAVLETDVIIHLAGQVAVTSSVLDPRDDFEINALGTFNVLEATRLHAPQATLIYASTNKVFGGMEQVKVVEREKRYEYADFPFGIPNDFPLDFHSPYGCSKGAGDQYMVDYARIYGLKTVVFRQSCIYGARQFGVEDQGWAAHFVIAAVKNRPITIYGNGKQVRDMLHVDDLIRAYDAAIERIDEVAGIPLNMGGGPDNTLSIWGEFGEMLEEYAGKPLPVSYGAWRQGDQPVFVADIRLATEKLNWQPTINPTDGIFELYNWAAANPHLFD